MSGFRQTEAHCKPSSGSVLLKTQKSTSTKNIKINNINQEVKAGSDVSTIGCLLHDVTDNGVWVITCFRSYINTTKEADMPVESHNLWSVVESGSERKACLVGDRYWWKQDWMTINEEQKYVDVVLFPLYRSTEYLGLYNTQLVPLNQIPKLYIGQDQYLLHRRVCKTGNIVSTT